MGPPFRSDIWILRLISRLKTLIKYIWHTFIIHSAQTSDYAFIWFTAIIYVVKETPSTDNININFKEYDGQE